MRLCVSRETRVRLQLHLQELRKWNPRINLVSAATLGDAVTRHFADSAQLVPLAPPEWVSWLDVGSGGGFPGLVIAAFSPDRSVTLVEADHRKSAFLAAVARVQAVNVSIHTGRVERYARPQADIISSRAVAPVASLLSMCEHLLSPTTTLLLLKGRRWKEEVSAAEAEWRFHLDGFPSKTDEEAAVLRIKNVSRI